jgi:Beige/BEACH domain
LNLFYYLTYENSIDLADIEDQQTKISKEAQIMHFGQTPSQIFGRPHITRNKLPKRRCFGYKKVSILLCLESDRMVSLLRQQGNRLVFFHDYSLLVYQEHHTYALEYEVRLLRNNSRDNLYYTE